MGPPADNLVTQAHSEPRAAIPPLNQRFTFVAPRHPIGTTEPPAKRQAMLRAVSKARPRHPDSTA
jgi:hypothetical protein